MKFQSFINVPSTLAISVTCACLCVSAVSFAAENALVISGKNFISTVADLDRSVVFYEEAFGLNTRISRSEPVGNPVVQALTDTGSAKLRVAYVEIPAADFLLEFTEFSNVERNPVHFNMHDPGNARLALSVSDIDAVLATALEAGAQMETLSGEILRREGANGAYNRAVFIRDLDGYLIELIQRYPQTESVDDSVVLSGSFSISVSDMQASAEFWAHFGVELVPIAALQGRNDAISNDLGATEDASLYGATADMPGSDFSWSVYEFQNIERQNLQPAIVDPGAPALSLFVNDMDVTLQAIEESGARIVSTDGEPVAFGGSRNIFVRGPDGFLYEFVRE